MISEYKKAMHVVVGLGKTGLSCVRFLVNNGIPCAVTDTREKPPGLEELQRDFPQVQVALGGLNRELLHKATEIVVSPGLSLHEPLLMECSNNGIAMIGDIELFARFAKAPICVITGANAKSTVTTMVAEMAQHAGLDVRMGGNIGIPALDLLTASEPELYVLEISSFQLETTYSLKAKAATILNISPDHMDRYNNLEEYIAAKQRIYQNCHTVVFNREDENTYSRYNGYAEAISFGLNAPQADEFGIFTTTSGYYLAYGSDALMPVKELPVKGRHNWANALAALALGQALHLPMSAMITALKNFHGLPHRCQLVGQKNDIGWYNDSKGTNVGATIAAIEGLGSEISGKLILIAGGLGKGADFSDLKKPVGEYVRTVILIGKDAPILADLLHDNAELMFANSMQEAVHIANDTAKPGDAVLLSPACASFDMFKDFEHRGEVFVQAVKDTLC